MGTCDVAQWVLLFDAGVYCRFHILRLVHQCIYVSINQYSTSLAQSILHMCGPSMAFMT